MNLEKLKPELTYHVYNRAHGNELMFKSDEDYGHFYQLILKYLVPILSVHSYCFMPNHFHFLVRIQCFNETAEHVNYSQTFSNMFNAYTRYFNLKHERRGGLFMRPFKRKLVEDDIYYSKIIHYIHMNPVHHGLVDNISSWDYSSYEALSSNYKTFLDRNYVINWFGSIEKFKLFHEPPVSL